ncbi:MAG: hypothetical protein IPG74_01415 [Flavobacteriales bacterium]|nr:hypothetical protein [Flavobacteriales bacterium]
MFLSTRFPAVPHGTSTSPSMVMARFKVALSRLSAEFATGPTAFAAPLDLPNTLNAVFFQSPKWRISKPFRSSALSAQWRWPLR